MAKTTKDLTKEEQNAIKIKKYSKLDCALDAATIVTGGLTAGVGAAVTISCVVPNDEGKTSDKGCMFISIPMFIAGVLGTVTGSRNVGKGIARNLQLRSEIQAQLAEDEAEQQ